MLTPLESFVLTHMGENFMEGANWGFCPPEDYERYLPTFQKEVVGVANFSVLKGRSGILIEVEPNFLVQALSKLPNVGFDNEDLNSALAERQLALVQFRTWVESNSNYQGFLGINETSDSKSVTINQVPYPSFKIGVDTFFHEFMNYKVQFLNNRNQWQYFDSGMDRQELINACSISPTRNCMVVPIKIEGRR
ncbi:hypothetical protein ACQUY5_18740 [Bacillus cereus]|uniref:hypothetical protein n=1 Tax=Bacillus cereus TaxID=1396 RepID=UPI003D16EC18